jgi:glycosyltransferase involved in cell wall biosynthesis
MKVFHGPVNISGMAGVLAQAQRHLGVDAKSYSFDNDFKYYVGKLIPTKTDILQYLRFFIKERLHKYDVYHFYFGYSLTGSALIDISILKLLRKKVYFYFCGCDIRDCKKMIEKYEFSACKNCWPMLCGKNRLKSKRIAEKYANGIFVSTPDLLEFVENSVWLPQPIDLERFNKIRGKYVQKSNNKKNIITIVHAPSSQQLKGTEFIERAIHELQHNGYPIKFILVKNMSNKRAMEICAKADIAIDQLLIGAYGQYSVEMMALGKPVICYIRDDLVQHYPDNLPIINANPDNILSVLRKTLDNYDQLDRLREASIDYVSKVHDRYVVANKALDIYRGK